MPLFWVSNLVNYTFFIPATALDRRLVSTPRVTTSNCSADRMRRRSMLEFFTILLAGSTVRATLAAFPIISSR